MYLLRCQLLYFSLSFISSLMNSCYEQEPQCKETYIRTCAPSEDSDQPAHPRSLIRIFTGAFWIAKDEKFLHATNEASDQSTRMRRLFWVFSLRIWQKVHFRTLRLICNISRWYFLPSETQWWDEIILKNGYWPLTDIYDQILIYSKTLMSRTPLRPWKFIRDMGTSNHWGLIIAPGQEANCDNLGNSSRSSTQ